MKKGYKADYVSKIMDSYADKKNEDIKAELDWLYSEIREHQEFSKAQAQTIDELTETVVNLEDKIKELSGESQEETSREELKEFTGLTDELLDVLYDNNEKRNRLDWRFYGACILLGIGFFVWAT